MSARGRRRAALVLAIACALAPAARAGDREAMDEYKAGVAAVQAGRHAEGLRHLEAALRERSSEGSFRVGVVSFDYAPSLWMARAHLALGACEPARAALAAARGVKMGSRDREMLGSIEASVAACGAAAPKPTAAAPAPPPVPAAAPATTPAREECPDLARARQALAAGDAGRALQLAKSCLERDAQDEAARSIVDTVNSSLSGRLAIARRRESEGDAQAALSLVREVLGVDPARQDARDLAQSLESTLALQRTRAPERVATQPPAPSVAAVAPARPEPSPVASARPLPAGVAAFFRGDVEASIHALEMESPTAESLVVLACALATRALLVPEEAAASRDLARARQAWDQARRLRPEASLEASWISPRVKAALQGS